MFHASSQRGVRHAERGFSLIEMMMIIGLISIASGFAYSSLMPYTVQYRVKGATFLLAAELQRARMEAVRTRLCHFFDRTGPLEFRIVQDDPANQNCILDPSDPTLRTISLAGQFPGVRMDASGATTDPFGLDVVAASPTSLRFEPRGVVTTVGGSAIFVSSDHFGPMAVTVTAAGAVRTWRKAGSTWH